MNECEMQIQLRQPPTLAQKSQASAAAAAAAAQQVVHRSRLEAERNLQKQNHRSRESQHALDLKVGPASPSTRKETARRPEVWHPSAAAADLGQSPSRNPVTDTVQRLLESFDNRIRSSVVPPTKCDNMSEETRLAGIPISTSTTAASSHVIPSSPPTTTGSSSPSNPAAAAALLLLKNRLIPPYQNGIDLSAHRSPRSSHHPHEPQPASARTMGEPKRTVKASAAPVVVNGEQQHSKRSSNSNGGGTHIPSTASPEAGAVVAAATSSPSSASSTSSSDCNSPPSNGGGPGGSANGSAGSGATKSINGGRLQFFKDGKFILELASSRETDNGRPSWVAVPRKIYWPPTAQGFTTYNAPSASTTPSTVMSGPTSATIHTTNSNHSFQKNGSSASLSFSDDNSSIQSSPWQRDHCWKQLAPRKGIARELCFVYVRPRQFLELTDRGHAVSVARRRRPYDGAGPILVAKDAFQRKKQAVEMEEEAVRQESEDLVKDREDDVDKKTDFKVDAKKAEHEGREEVKVDVVEEDKKVKNEEDCSKSTTTTSAKVEKEVVVKVENMEEDSVDGAAAAVKGAEPQKVHTGADSGADETDSNKTVTDEAELERNRSPLATDTADDEKMDICKEEVAEKTKDQPVEEKGRLINGLEEELKSLKAATTATANRRIRRARKPLDGIIAGLVTSQKAFINKLKLSSPKLDALMHSHMHQHVSPRKRILREFERVSLDEGAAAGGGGGGSSGGVPLPSGMKRHRSKAHHHNGNGGGGSSNGGGVIHTNTKSSSTFFVPSTGMVMGAPNNSGSSISNGRDKMGSGGVAAAAAKESAMNRPLAAPPPPSPQQPQSKPISSYSIISLLGHHSSGSSPRSAEAQPVENYQHLSSSQQQQQQQNQHEGGSLKGMDLHQYTKSLPPKKKLSPPPSLLQQHNHQHPAGSNPSWSSPKGTESPLSAASAGPPGSGSSSYGSHLMMRSPEMSPSPDRLGYKPHGGYGGNSSQAAAAAASFHPYLNVSNRASPSADDGASSNGDRASSTSSSRYAHHRSSPQQQQFVVRDRHLSGSSPTARYSPIHHAGKNPPMAHGPGGGGGGISGGGGVSPYSTSSSRPSPIAAATSPLSSHYFPPHLQQHATSKGRRSPSPHQDAMRASERERERFDRHPVQYHSQRRLIDEERDRATDQELCSSAAALKQQMEFERYAKFYGSAPHSMLAPGHVPPHLMVPGFEQHMSEAAAAAHLMRPSAAGPGASPASLMSSLHQAAYLMYPPTAAAAAAAAAAALPPSSMPYYQQYMAAAAAMYPRGSALWPYMTAAGPPPPGSPHSMGGGGGRLPPGMHHSPQMMGHGGRDGRGLGVGGGGGERSERMSPGSPLALRMAEREQRGHAREVALAMEQSRDDPDVPLNLSKH